MVFITAGMGGGTGTGAAPVIAKIAKDLGILTVGIVTTPFGWEGKKKKAQADLGLEELKASCDTVVTILNDRLSEIFGQLTLRQAFAQADNVLTTAAKSIAEIITVTADVNVDFEDVKTVMKDSGVAVMGSASVSGENRALRAAGEALTSPLLNNTDIHGAQKILLSIMYGDEDELRMDELDQITNYIEERTGGEAEIIFGYGSDASLGNQIRVTMIATGFDAGQSLSNPEKVHFELSSGKQTSLFPSAEKPVQDPKQTDIFSETPSKSEQSKNTPKEDEKEYVSLNGKYEVTFVDKTDGESTTPPPPPQKSASQQADDLRNKRLNMTKQYSDRIKKLYALSENNENALEELYKKPAYMRANAPLQDTPDPNDHETSRYNLNDDKGLLGNNKFLHDNVD